jgi:hypothetical protein
MPEDDAKAGGSPTGADKAKGAEKPAPNPKEWTADFSNPIVVLSLLILLSLFVMIGASMLGIDHGFLASMAKADLARGLITYLFAVVTIGIAVALVLSTLVGPEPTDVNDGRFQRGKEVLSLLLGVFGTIVGFYFGSESSSSAKETPYQLSSIDIAPQPVGTAGQITVRAVVRAVVHQSGSVSGRAPIRSRSRTSFSMADGSSSRFSSSPRSPAKARAFACWSRMRRERDLSRSARSREVHRISRLRHRRPRRTNRKMRAAGKRPLVNPSLILFAKIAGSVAVPNGRWRARVMNSRFP